MGVDTYVAEGPEQTVLSPENYAAFVGLDLPLCEWCVGGGEVSFRGRQYAGLAADVTNHTFTYDYLSPEAVREMALDFARCDPEEVVARGVGGTEPSVKEILAMRQLLAICAARSLGLQGM